MRWSFLFALWASVCVVAASGASAAERRVQGFVSPTGDIRCAIVTAGRLSCTIDGADYAERFRRECRPSGQWHIVFGPTGRGRIPCSAAPERRTTRRIKCTGHPWSGFVPADRCSDGTVAVARYEFSALFAISGLGLFVLGILGFKLAAAMRKPPTIVATLKNAARSEGGALMSAVGVAVAVFVPLALQSDAIGCHNYPWYGLGAPEGCDTSPTLTSGIYFSVTGAIAVGLIWAGFALGRFLATPPPPPPPPVMTRYETVVVHSDPPGAVIFGADGRQWGITDRRDPTAVRVTFFQESNDTSRSDQVTITARKRGYEDATHQLSLRFPYYSQIGAANEPTEVTLILSSAEFADS